MTSTHAERYRLVTRSDFDGLVCAALLKHLGILDDILFVHPKDVQDGKVEIGPNDVTTNLPYNPNAAISFDHHHSETVRVGEDKPNHVIVPDADSAARVVYDYYGGAEAFPGIEELMEAVDKGDAAQFSLRGDPRTRRLGAAELPDGPAHRPRPLPRVPDLQLPADDAADRRVHRDVDRGDPADAGRQGARRALQRRTPSRPQEQIKRCATVHGNLVVLDLRDEEVIHPTNRFMLYALFPECNISIHVLWGLRQQNTVFATGKSILDRSSKTNVGELMLSYGGGGHEAAGTCQVENEDAPRVLQELIDKINADG